MSQYPYWYAICRINNLAWTGVDKDPWAYMETKYLENDVLPWRGPIQKVIQTVLEDLKTGTLGQAIKQGHHAFENGLDTSAVLDDQVRHAAQFRHIFPQALYYLDKSGLDIYPLLLTLAQVDDAHENHGRAVYLIDEDCLWRDPESYNTDEPGWWKLPDLGFYQEAHNLKWVLREIF